MLLLPLEIVRARLIVQSLHSESERKFNGFFDTLKQVLIGQYLMASKEGFSISWKISFLYHSCFPLFKIFPFLLFSKENSSWTTKLALAFTTQLIYLGISLPLDLLRKRLFIQAKLTESPSRASHFSYPLIPYVTCVSIPGPLYYSNFSIWNSLQRIRQEEGILKLWTGFTLRFCSVLPSLLSTYFHA